MTQSRPIRSISWCIVSTFIAGLVASGCGEDMSQPKTVIPAQSPAEKAKASQQFFMQGAPQKSTKKAKG